jgi:hypothetical protein
MMLTFRFFRRQTILRAVLFCALAATTAAFQAHSQQLDKHARKIEKQLARFRTGSYLEFDFRDRTANFGALGQLTETSFQYTDSDNNKLVTRSYDELEHVSKAKEFIGEGSRHHHISHWVPISVGAAAAGAAAAAVLMTR